MSARSLSIAILLFASASVAVPIRADAEPTGETDTINCQLPRADTPQQGEPWPSAIVCQVDEDGDPVATGGANSGSEAGASLSRDAGPVNMREAEQLISLILALDTLFATPQPLP